MLFQLQGKNIAGRRLSLFRKARSMTIVLFEGSLQLSHGRAFHAFVAHTCRVSTCRLPSCFSRTTSFRHHSSGPSSSFAQVPFEIRDSAEWSFLEYTWHVHPAYTGHVQGITSPSRATTKEPHGYSCRPRRRVARIFSSFSHSSGIHHRNGDTSSRDG